MMKKLNMLFLAALALLVCGFAQAADTVASSVAPTVASSVASSVASAVAPGSAVVAAVVAEVAAEVVAEAAGPDLQAAAVLLAVNHAIRSSGENFLDR